jgi:hypothetical protein
MNTSNHCIQYNFFAEQEYFSKTIFDQEIVCIDFPAMLSGDGKNKRRLPDR